MTKKMKKMKTLEELNLLDRFLFAEAMEHKEISEIILSIIMGAQVHIKGASESEKEVRCLPDSRSVRLDVYTVDEDDTVYNSEVQKKDTGNLPTRSRLYQAMIDCNLLEIGESDFNLLNNVYMIMITPFDLFGADRYQYTFHMMCDEVPDIRLEDGATRIFLNIKGKNDEETSEELVELLHYIGDSRESTSGKCKSSRVQQLHEQVQKLKKDKEVGVKYMQAWEERELDKREAKAEGLEEGLSVGEMFKLIELTQKKLKKSKTCAQIAEELETDEGKIRLICEAVEACGLDSDKETIYEKMMSVKNLI